MIIRRLAIPDVLLLEPDRIHDERGFFVETFRESRLAEFGISCRFVQDNHSSSIWKGTLRGLHYQRAPHAQDKLVRVVRGGIQAVAVDLRRDSRTFGCHVSVELTARNGLQIFLPKGFAHGLVTLEPETEVAYKVSDYHHPECETGIRWNDPDLAIDWNLCGDPVLSPKDEALPAWKDSFTAGP